MFAKQIVSEAENHGFCARIVDLQDVVDNDDFDFHHNGEEEDEDAALLRATFAHPRYRDDHDDDNTGDTAAAAAAADSNGHHKLPQQRSKALFFMATYGEGEPTDNAQQFVDIMKIKSGISNIYKFGTEIHGDGTMSASASSGSISLGDDNDGAKETAAAADGRRDSNFLHDIDYAVFGLGNMQYEHYNNMGRFIDAALEQCGARRVAPIGLGNDDDDLEGDFETWKDNVLWPALMGRYVKKGAMKKATVENGEGGKKTAALPPCPYTVEYLQTAAVGITSSPDSSIQTSSKHYSQAVDCPVVASRELRDPSDPGSTIHMEIDISKHMDTMKYTTADNLGILPKNDDATVKAVADALNFDLDRVFHLLPSNNDNIKKDGGGSAESSSSKHTLPFPTPCTVRECLERYCDLTGPPRRSDLKQLAPYAQNDMDRKALLRMSSKEGKAEYKEKIIEAHVGIADIVTRLCTSIVCPLEHFIMVCPRLQPRYYTISSSSTVYPTTIHITLAVLETEKKVAGAAGGGVFRGLCSGYLAGLKNGDLIRAFVRESTFRLPKQVGRPVIMFGPGTGIAPMRAILQERSHGRKNGVEHGASILYFGCKNRTMDYIYRDELELLRDEGTLTELHLAFSREQNHKVYVQNLLAQRAAETWRLIHDEMASIFVCGAVKMGADVDHTLQDIISEQGGMSREKAKAYLDKMAVAGRFIQELWS